jgi:hypothetical protein
MAECGEGIFKERFENRTLCIQGHIIDVPPNAQH